MDLKRIYDLFVGNPSVHGLKTNKGWIQSKEPITKELLQKHLNKKIKIGSYNAYIKDNKDFCKWICLDVDFHDTPKTLEFDELIQSADSKEKRKILKEQKKKYEKTEDYITEVIGLKDRAINDMNQIELLINKSDIPKNCILNEESKRGWHFWVFLYNNTPLKLAFDVGQDLKRKIMDNFNYEVESFPKQFIIKKGDYGNFVGLPEEDQIPEKLILYNSSKYKFPLPSLNKIDKQISGIPLRDFINGKIDPHKDIKIKDKDKRMKTEFLLWKESMFVLKDLGYSQNEVLEAFSNIIGFDEKTSKQQIKSWWDKDNDPKRVIASEIKPKKENSLGRKDDIFKIINELSDNFEDITREEIDMILDITPKETIAQKHIFLKLKKKTGLTLTELKSMYESINKKKETEQPKESKEPKEKQLSKEECDKLLLGINRPFEWLKKTFELIHESNDEKLLLLATLMIGTNLGYKSHVIVHGSSGSGKSYGIITCLPLLDSEDILEAINITEGVFKRIGDQLLKDKKVLYLKEMDGISKDNIIGNLALKLMSGDDQGGTFYFCEKVGENWEPVKRKMEAMAIFMPYAKVWVENEENTRVWSIEVNQNRSHIINIINNRIYEDDDILDIKKQKFDNLMKAWRQVINPKLKSIKYGVKIPYRKVIAAMFTSGKIESSVIRDSKRFKQLLQIITKLNYTINPNSRTIQRNYIIANCEDFEQACEIGWLVSSQKMSKVNENQLKLMDALHLLQNQIESAFIDDGSGDIKAEDLKKGFTPSEIFEKCEDMGCGLKYAQRLLNQLKSNNLIIAGKTSKKGDKTYTYLPNKSIDSENFNWKRFLPDVKEELNSVYFEIHAISSDLKAVGE